MANSVDDPFYTVKRMFLYRLTSHYLLGDVKYSFVMDAFKVISDLGLEHTVLQFLDSGIFQSKLSWKKAVQENLKLKSEQLPLAEMQGDNHDRFLKLHAEVKPSYFWLLSRRQPHLLSACKSAVRAISFLFNRNVRPLCLACGNVIADADHRLMCCPVFISIRYKMWHVWQRFGVDLYLRLVSMDSEDLADIMLGRFDCILDSLSTQQTLDEFYGIIACYIQRVFPF